MKKIIGILFLTVLFGCDSENSLNCFQEAGNIVLEEFPVASFDRIIVWERTQLIIEQGPIQKVVVETGANLLNDIEISVTDGLLELRNNNGCNLVRDYGLTKIYVTTPDLKEIRSSSGLPVQSRGVLQFSELMLLSEDQNNEDEYHIDGDFSLNLNVQELRVIANGLSNFYLTGEADFAFFGFYDGDNLLNAEDFIVQDINIFHRGTQDMIVFPEASIRGQIVSLGNVIAKNRPPIIEVEELFEGRLIFD